MSLIGSGTSLQVLVIGGDGGEGTPPVAEIEVLHPDRTPPDAFTTIGATLRTARRHHTATVLRSGDVLVVGGTDAAGQPVAGAELVDQVARATTAAGSLARPRSRHAAALLRDGRVLIVGGVDSEGKPVPQVEIFNPALGTFVAARPLSVPRAAPSAVELCDGRILVVGGGAGAELYTPNPPAP
jgi:hypothetical protein